MNEQPSFCLLYAVVCFLVRSFAWLSLQRLAVFSGVA